MFERENKKLEEFYKKKSDLKQRLQKDLIRNGIAHLPCKVSGVDDILSKFSTPGIESLDGIWSIRLLTILKASAYSVMSVSSTNTF